jgi:hypothetical protein
MITMRQTVLKRVDFPAMLGPVIRRLWVLLSKVISFATSSVPCPFYFRALIRHGCRIPCIRIHYFVPSSTAPTLGLHMPSSLLT